MLHYLNWILIHGSASFQPRVTIGRGSLLCMLTLFVMSIFTIFVCSSLPPLPASDDGSLGLSVVAMDHVPLNNGFIRMFSLSYSAVTTMNIPATFATAFGFIYGYSRVILSMARSGLFPSFLADTYGEYQTPYAAIIAGSTVSYLLVLIAYFMPLVVTYLFNICILAGFTTYISQLIGFILMRIRHPTQERLFVSPLGVPGAVVGMIVFGFSAVSVIGFQEDNSMVFCIYLCIVAVCTFYYFFYAKKRQFFSVEEKFIFVLQIVKCK